jgi:hypothetical protein
MLSVVRKAELPPIPDREKSRELEMPKYASQLATSDAIVANDGLQAQINLSNADGDKFSFTVRFHKFGRFLFEMRRIAALMSKNLETRSENEKAELLRAAPEAPLVSKVQVAVEKDSGLVTLFSCWRATQFWR